MSSVTFSSSVGGNNTTVTDDANPATGLANGGHRTRFVPALAQLVAVAGFVVTEANLAAGYAASAANAPGTSATTTSSVTVGTGSKSFTLAQTNKAFSKGQRVRVASDANPLNSIAGPITAFTPASGAMTINADATTGSGTFTDGVVSLDASGGIPATRQISVAGGILSGGGDFSADRTITLTRSQASGIRAATATDTVVTPGDMASALAEVTLQDGANITTVGDASLDMSKFINGVVTLGGNRTLPNPINHTPGGGRIRIVQDGTGTRLLAFGSYWKRAGGAGSLSAAAGANDILEYDVINATMIVYDIIKSPS